MKIKISAALALASLLQGCIPQTLTYSRLEAPDAQYFRSSCFGGAGAPSVIYYPFHGIFVSLDITGFVRLGLHVPEGAVAQLNDNQIKIEGRNVNGQRLAFAGRLRAALQGSVGSVHPNEFRAMPDPFTSPDEMGPLRGASKNGKHIWYFYTVSNPQDARRLASVPGGLASGTVTLPSISVNGVQYSPQEIPFKMDRYSELSPINC